MDKKCKKKFRFNVNIFKKNKKIQSIIANYNNGTMRESNKAISYDARQINHDLFDIENVNFYSNPTYFFFLRIMSIV